MNLLEYDNDAIDCDVAVLEADGRCRVIASRSEKRRLKVGGDFFQLIGASATEVQFALEKLFKDPFHPVWIRSRAGAVLLSGYYYLSVRLLVAVIPHASVSSVAKVVDASYSDFLLSPEMEHRVKKTKDINADDDKTYHLLQKLRICMEMAFPPVQLGTTYSGEEIMKLAYSTARAMARLVGRDFGMGRSKLKGFLPIGYDPVMGSLFFLVFFCYASRTAGSGKILFSVHAEEGTEASFSLRDKGKIQDAPELKFLSELERYNRQLMDVFESENSVELRLFLQQQDPQELLGLKHPTPTMNREEILQGLVISLIIGS